MGAFKTFRSLLLFLLLIPFQFMYGQNTGYLGRKFILKTNLVNGLRLGFNNCDLEYVVGRKLSVYASYELLNYSVGPVSPRARTGEIKPRNGPGRLRETTTLEQGTTKGWIASAGIRLYFNRIVPAPYGFYTQLGLGIGSATFGDFSVSYKLANKFGGKSSEPPNARPGATGLSGQSGIFFFEAPSLGFQKIVWKRLVLDGRLSVQGQYCSLPDNLLNAMERNYYTRANVLSYGLGNLSLGLAAYVKVGILLF